MKYEAPSGYENCSSCCDCDYHISEPQYDFQAPENKDFTRSSFRVNDLDVYQVANNAVTYLSADYRTTFSRSFFRAM